MLWNQDLQTVFLRVTITSLRDITPGQVFVFVKEQKLTVQVLDVDVSGAVHSLPDRSTQAVRPGGLIQDQGHSAGKGLNQSPYQAPFGSRILDFFWTVQSLLLYFSHISGLFLDVKVHIISFYLYFWTFSGL